MSGVLVDSNVLLDLFTEDPVWAGWSGAALERVGETSTLVINPIIYAEVSVRFPTIEEVDEALSGSFFRREPLSWAAAFLAGKSFARYRRNGGAKRSPLPDFLIGAHAAVMDYEILTRDAARYRTYFPTVQLIAP
ncbi:MAG TPA: type II toxin-antitoxin system VapC family toxin [Geminicoccaceae bacterium]|nr:type II toxin-antitoxin system VapC family toxin [Geminicoccus sp.]HMU53082.1 type II toxin-antitoxin system VapC family toxin [Geminicoccaceae bacterium]